jgi:stage V sporulation protein S
METHLRHRNWRRDTPWQDQGRKKAVDIIRVATGSRPTAVAGAIAASVRESNEAKVQAIGPHAVNQAMKAIAVARGYLELDGLVIVCVPTFTEVAVDGGKRTAMRFLVGPR